MLLSPPPSFPFSNIHTMKLENMKDGEIGEDELLSLSLNSSWCSNISTTAAAATKKRKRKRKRNIKDEAQILQDNKFITLLQSRDQMLKLDPKRHGLEDGKGLQLIHLLLISATAIDSNNISSAVDSLTELYQTVSLNGDPIQRVTAYFADGLAAKLLTKSSPFHDIIVANPTPEEEFSAFTYLYRASPYYQFAHFTANQAIIEAFEEEEDHNRRSLHVIDFDVSYGFQWPSLIQSLSDKATSTKPISLRITGFGQSVEDLRETETRLANFAKGCHNLFFEFVGCLQGSSDASEYLNIKKDVTLVVNSVFYLQSLKTSSELAATLKNIYLLNPSVVVLVEKEGSRTPQSFLSIFMESLHYFAAMFDFLDDCLPAESAERLSIEKNHLGREIMRVVTGDHHQDCHEDDKNAKKKYERLDTWKEMMERNGFEEVKLSSRSISQAKLLLKIKSYSTTDYRINCGGFQISERDEGRGLSLGWQDRHLITASAWRCISHP